MLKLTEIFFFYLLHNYSVLEHADIFVPLRKKINLHCLGLQWEYKRWTVIIQTSQ